MSWHNDERKLAVARLARVMRKYKRGRDAVKGAQAIRDAVEAVVLPYLRATETQRVVGNAQCNAAADTQAARTQGAGGVSLLASRGTANSFSPSGTNTQCSQSDYTIVPIQPAVTLAGVLARYAKPVGVVLDSGREKAPEPEEARGAEPEVKPLVIVEWPSECEVLVTGVCPNPRLMAGEIWAGGRKTGRKVSLWKTWKGERAGAVVKARLERGSGREALYQVIP